MVVSLDAKPLKNRHKYTKNHNHEYCEIHGKKHIKNITHVKCDVNTRYNKRRDTYIEEYRICKVKNRNRYSDNAHDDYYIEDTDYRIDNHNNVTTKSIVHNNDPEDGINYSIDVSYPSGLDNWLN